MADRIMPQIRVLIVDGDPVGTAGLAAHLAVTVADAARSAAIPRFRLHPCAPERIYDGVG
jgi:hypothetical protein